MRDPTENCSINDWYQCQHTRCRWHGTCHNEAMLQPPPSSDDYSIPDDGILDGGEPYTQEELNVINR